MNQSTTYVCCIVILVQLALLTTPVARSLKRKAPEDSSSGKLRLLTPKTRLTRNFRLWYHLRAEGLSLMTNRLNQDCLENSFSAIRQKGGFRDSPDTEQFKASVKALMTENLMRSSRLTNCEEDLVEVLLFASSFPSGNLPPDVIGLGGKNQPIKARSLFFPAHGKCFQVSMAHKPAGASSFSFKGQSSPAFPGLRARHLRTRTLPDEVDLTQLFVDYAVAATCFHGPQASRRQFVLVQRLTALEGTHATSPPVPTPECEPSQLIPSEPSQACPKLTSPEPSQTVPVLLAVSSPVTGP
ncbi:hypothetical protein ISCGN_010820 [Ixodes scapularis]